MNKYIILVAMAMVACSDYEATLDPQEHNITVSTRATEDDNDSFTNSSTIRMGMFQGNDTDGYSVYGDIDIYSNLYGTKNDGGWLFGYGSKGDMAYITYTINDDRSYPLIAAISPHSPTADLTNMYFYVPTTYSTTDCISHAHATVTAENTWVNLEFKYLYAILQFNVKLKRYHYSTYLTKIAFNSDTECIVDRGYLNAITGGVTPATMTNVRSFYSYATLDDSNKLYDEKSNDFYGYTYPIEYNDDNKLSIIFYTQGTSDNYKIDGEIPINFSIEAGKRYVFDVTIDNSLKFSKVVLNEKWSEDIVDIGAKI